MNVLGSFSSLHSRRQSRLSSTFTMAGRLQVVPAKVSAARLQGEAAPAPRSSQPNACELDKSVLMPVGHRARKQPRRVRAAWAGVTKGSQRLVDRCKQSVKSLPAKLKCDEPELRSMRLMMDEFSWAI